MAKENSTKIPPKGELPIEVDKAVVKHLSIGLYRNYALAVKELISNAYDAGATEIKIKLDLKGRRIVVRDNGRGMDYTDLKNDYLRIGYPKEPSRKQMSWDGCESAHLELVFSLHSHTARG